MAQNRRDSDSVADESNGGTENQTRPEFWKSRMPYLLGTVLPVVVFVGADSAAAAPQEAADPHQTRHDSGVQSGVRGPDDARREVFNRISIDEGSDFREQSTEAMWPTPNVVSPKETEEIEHGPAAPLPYDAARQTDTGPRIDPLIAGHQSPADDAGSPVSRPTKPATKKPTLPPTETPPSLSAPAFQAPTIRLDAFDLTLPEPTGPETTRPETTRLETTGPENTEYGPLRTPTVSKVTKGTPPAADPLAAAKARLAADRADERNPSAGIDLLYAGLTPVKAAVDRSPRVSNPTVADVPPLVSDLGAKTTRITTDQAVGAAQLRVVVPRIFTGRTAYGLVNDGTTLSSEKGSVAKETIGRANVTTAQFGDPTVLGLMGQHEYIRGDTTHIITGDQLSGRLTGSQTTSVVLAQLDMFPMRIILSGRSTFEDVAGTSRKVLPDGSTTTSVVERLERTRTGLTFSGGFGGRSPLLTTPEPGNPTSWGRALFGKQDFSWAGFLAGRTTVGGEVVSGWRLFTTKEKARERTRNSARPDVETVLESEGSALSLGFRFGGEYTMNGTAWGSLMGRQNASKAYVWNLTDQGKATTVTTENGQHRADGHLDHYSNAFAPEDWTEYGHASYDPNGKLVEIDRRFGFETLSLDASRESRSWVSSDGVFHDNLDVTTEPGVIGPKGFFRPDEEIDRVATVSPDRTVRVTYSSKPTSFAIEQTAKTATKLVRADGTIFSIYETTTDKPGYHREETETYKVQPGNVLVFTGKVETKGRLADVRTDTIDAEISPGGPASYEHTIVDSTSGKARTTQITAYSTPGAEAKYSLYQELENGPNVDSTLYETTVRPGLVDLRRVVLDGATGETTTDTTSFNGKNVSLGRFTAIDAINGPIITQGPTSTTPVQGSVTLTDIATAPSKNAQVTFSQTQDEITVETVGTTSQMTAKANRNAAFSISQTQSDGPDSSTSTEVNASSNGAEITYATPGRTGSSTEMSADPNSASVNRTDSDKFSRDPDSGKQSGRRTVRAAKTNNGNSEVSSETVDRHRFGAESEQDSASISRTGEIKVSDNFEIGTPLSTNERDWEIVLDEGGVVTMTGEADKEERIYHDRHHSQFTRVEKGEMIGLDVVTTISNGSELEQTIRPYASKRGGPPSDSATSLAGQGVEHIAPASPDRVPADRPTMPVDPRPAVEPTPPTDTDPAPKVPSQPAPPASDIPTPTPPTVDPTPDPDTDPEPADPPTPPASDIPTPTPPTVDPTPDPAPPIIVAVTDPTTGPILVDPVEIGTDNPCRDLPPGFKHTHCPPRTCIVALDDDEPASPPPGLGPNPILTQAVINGILYNCWRPNPWVIA